MNVSGLAYVKAVILINDWFLLIYLITVLSLPIVLAAYLPASSPVCVIYTRHWSQWGSSHSAAAVSHTHGPSYPMLKTSKAMSTSRSHLSGKCKKVLIWTLR